MAETRTEVIVSAKAKGFTEVQQQATKLAGEASKATDAQAKGYSDVGKTVEQLQNRLKELTREQLDLNRALEGVADRGSPAYEKLVKNLKAVETEGDRVERVLRRMERAFKDQTRQISEMQQKGALLQGFLQGAMPGAPFLQRGPGMGRQVVGMAAGRAVRGVAGGMAQAPFAGAQGIAQALSAIPIVGGALAAPFQQAMQYGQTALGRQRARVQALPTLGFAGMAPTISEAGRTAGARAAVAARERVLGQLGGPEMEARVRERAEGMMQLQARRMEPVVQPTGGLFENRAMIDAMNRAGNLQRLRSSDFGGEIRGAARESIERDIRQEAPRAAERARRTARREEESRQRRALFRPIRQAGQFLGVSEEQAIQMVGGITGAAGGDVRQLQRQGMLGTGERGRPGAAIAAQALFGVEAPVTGAFARMGRLGAAGGLPGAQGAGSRMMTSAIADAMRMGLEGSEITTYLQQMAAGITQWEQTGIPIATDAMGEFGRAMSEAGFGGVRGAAVGGGFVRAAQALSTRGPQSAGELMMLQTMGGFRGGGAGAFEEAQIRLERLRSGEAGPEQVQELIGRFMQAGGGGAAGRLLARQQLSGMGIQVGAEEMSLIGRRMQGETLTPEQTQRLQAIQAQREAAGQGAPTSPEELQQRASRMMEGFGAALQKRARIENQQADAGERMIPTLNNLDKMTANLASKFTELADEPMKKLTGAMEELTAAIADKDKSLLSVLREWTVGF